MTTHEEIAKRNSATAGRSALAERQDRRDGPDVRSGRGGRAYRGCRGESGTGGVGGAPGTALGTALWACAVLLSGGGPDAFAQVPPVTPGFPNVPQTAGTALSGLNAPQQGRTAIIAYHNGVLITMPEIPASQPGADYQVRTWDIADPTQPVELATWGVTPHPIAAHGYLKRGEHLVMGGNWPVGSEWTFLAGPNNTVSRVPSPDNLCAWSRGCLFSPWFAPMYWSYDEVGGDAWISLDGVELSRWDHLGLTGVIGHPFIFGDLLIMASDQSRTGVATYDISDPTSPVLLDVLNTGGPGGYWPELWGGDGKLYMVFPYRTNGNGFRVVDLTDPTDLRFLTDRPLPGTESMYIQFQDEFAFMGGHKVDMRSMQSVLFLDGDNVERPNEPGVFGISTSQFLLPLGNLLVTGGIGPDEGMAIWAHQDAPDTRGPSVGYHIPETGRTNYSTVAPISLLIHETLETFTLINGETFIVRPVGGSFLPGRITFSFDDVLTFTPDDPLLPDTTYEVVIPAGGIKDAAGNGIEGYSFSFSTGSNVAGNSPPSVTAFDVSSYPAEPGQEVTLSVSAEDPDLDSLEYRFDAGDGSPKTPWSPTPAVQVAWAGSGHYRATVQVRDSNGSIVSSSRSVTVLTPPVGPSGPHSSQLHCDAPSRTVWAVNPDNGTLSAVHADTLAKVSEVDVCTDPRSVAASASGQLWVACHDEDTIAVRDGAGAAVDSIDLGYGAAPVGLAMSPDGSTAWVALSGAGTLVRIDTTSRTVTGTLALGPNPWAVAMTPDGSRVLVTRFLSPAHHAEVWDVDAATLTLNDTIEIAKFGDSEHRDTTASGFGVANYLADVLIAADGQTAWVAANKPNNERGLLNSHDLDEDNSVRNIVVQLDLTSNSVLRSIDIDNSDSASALSFSPLGDYLFVTLQGNDEVLVLDLLENESASGLGSFVSRIGTGSAPQAVCTDSTTDRTFVKDFLSRSVTALETAELLRSGSLSVSSSTTSTVAVETLAATVLAGKQIFYNASDPRMSSEGYLSCATCHVDGAHDGRTWDFTGRGEGLRNTTTLHGRRGTGHGNVHWTGNFDEIQDFEHDIRGAFGGSGFLTDSDFAATSQTLGPMKAGLSADLDALADYVASLDDSSIPRSPHRNADGSMTAAGVAGRQVFNDLACNACHTGADFTDSTVGTATLQDAGTVRSSSGQRLGDTLTGLDTPTLRGLWDTAPYLHDGSAETLADVFFAAGGDWVPAESGSIAGEGWVVDQWVELNNDDKVRDRAYVNLRRSGSVTLRGMSGGSGGTGNVEFRYSNSGPSDVEVIVNGTSYPMLLPDSGNFPTWRTTNWSVARVEGVPLGSSNKVEIVAGPHVWGLGIDEVMVTPSSRLNAASAHLIAGLLPQAAQDELLAYLLQLDGTPELNGSVDGFRLRQFKGTRLDRAAGQQKAVLKSLTFDATSASYDTTDAFSVSVALPGGTTALATIAPSDPDWKVTPKRWKWRARTAPNAGGLHTLILPAPGLSGRIQAKWKNADLTGLFGGGGIPVAVRFSAGSAEWAGMTPLCRASSTGGTLICK